MIDFKHVTKVYDDTKTEALIDVSFHIDPGEFVFIVGDSGSGKSTIIKLLTKELDPTEGEIVVNEQELKKVKHRHIPMYRRNIGCVFQDFRLLPDRNVYENVAFAQRIVEASKKEIKRKVPAILATVGLAGSYKSRPKQLSGGEQQRVAIARALINEPKILLADEPTGNLDPDNTRDVMDLLENINKRGTTVIVVTHNMEVVSRMKKRVITIKNGILVSDEKGAGNEGSDDIVHL